ncbi:hypothetical protein CANINC_003143 [Pichia inconspicua]|uniref:HDA1 complex subunit 3 n=1 Tax=Pichia inconspicua TaxID=52247 RepID=A0A4T0WZG9_9ASCO|nr:hypothetical protein CANINC_003143 [[Candida] inconspicua]
MDLLRILDAKPEPAIVDNDHFQIDTIYQYSNHYNIATPMSDFQKELIDQIISLHYSDILLFFEKLDNNTWNSTSKNKREIISSSLETLLRNAKLVCLHPYLLIDHFFPKSLTTRDLPTRLAETSGKFQILNDILIQLDSIYNNKYKDANSVHLGIFVRAGKAMDLIDALCIGFKCNLKRYSGIKLRDSSANQKKNINLNLNIHLLPLDSDSLNEKEWSALKSSNIKLDFAILFDINTDPSDLITASIVNPYHTKFLRLVPINSVEHIELYYENCVKTRGIEEFIKPITAAIVCLRDKVGMLPSNLKPAYNKNFIYLREYLGNPRTVKWPLPDLPPIRNYTSRDVEKSLLTEVKFNFDNDELLKEEQENQQRSVESSLNTNFGGKTKMISHIIQPRFSKKNPTCKNYYENKRLMKNYLMNPLNNEYENLTGISREINHNDVLTHTLIYHFDMSIKRMIDLNKEVESFNEFSNIRLNDYQVMLDAYLKLKNDVEKKTVDLELINKTINEYTDNVNNAKEDIKNLNGKIEALTKDESVDPVVREYINKDLEKYQLLEEIAKMEQKLENCNNENKYMLEEISRADKSIADSNVKIDTLTKSNNELNSKVEAIKTDDSAIVSAQKSLDTATVKLKGLEKESENVKGELADAIAKLNDIGSRPRHVNYYGRNK